MATQIWPPGKTEPLKWKGSIDELGYRTHLAIFLINSTTGLDGPDNVLNTVGLPIAGTPWNYFSDNNPNIWCRKNAEADPAVDPKGGKVYWWFVGTTFSNKPDSTCATDSVDNPLIQPPDISGSFVKYTKEAILDRHGALTKTVSHEMIRGPQNEWDANKPTVKIGQNVLNLELATFAQMVDTLNSVPMWGLPVRCVKLSNVSWQRLRYGTCNTYYRREFEFDVDYATFDRYVVSEGYKALSGKWSTASGTWVSVPITGYGGTPNPDPARPDHFIEFQDRKGNLARVIHDEDGNPALTPIYDFESEYVSGNPFPIKIEYYNESNFLLLGIPPSF